MSANNGVLRRALRDHGDTLPEADRIPIDRAADHLDRGLTGLGRDINLDQVRGVEGDAAKVYFGAFPKLLREPSFDFNGRVRRPPTDPVNALLSFVYALLTHDARSALEGVGLDSGSRFFASRSAKSTDLALDLVEEFRAWFADRLVLTLINRRQVGPGGFHKDRRRGRPTDGCRTPRGPDHLSGSQARGAANILYRGTIARWTTLARAGYRGLAMDTTVTALRNGKVLLSADGGA